MPWPGTSTRMSRGSDKHREVVLIGIDVDDHEGVGAAAQRGIVRLRLSEPSTSMFIADGEGGPGGVVDRGAPPTRPARPSRPPRPSGRGVGADGGEACSCERRADLGRHAGVGGGDLGPEPQIGAAGAGQDEQHERDGRTRRRSSSTGAWVVPRPRTACSASSSTSSDLLPLAGEAEILLVNLPRRSKSANAGCGSGHSLHIGPQGSQFLLETFVAAIDMLHFPQFRAAFGRAARPWPGPLPPADRDSARWRPSAPGRR